MKWYRKARIKIIVWWRKFGSWLFWPEWEYRNDWVDEHGQWFLNLYEPDFGKTKYQLYERNDVTQDSAISKWYNNSLYKLSAGWLINDIKLKTGLTARVYILSKDKSIKDLQGMGRQEMLGNSEYRDIPIPRIVEIEIKGLTHRGWLTEGERAEVIQFLKDWFEGSHTSSNLNK